VLASRPPGPTGDDLRWSAREYITRELAQGSQDVSVRTMASHLGICSRSIQRRLHSANTTWSALVDEVRSEMAQSMLCESRIPLTEVAGRLGFSDPSTFCRAFRRWTGTSPQAFRTTRYETDAWGCDAGASSPPSSH
jgi:AraC-like DNA-binding protein